MALQWSNFAALEGDPKRNLELLVRGLVQRNYGRFGQLRSVRQQPGVEFHLKLLQDCDLGGAGRHFGWQCRWYDLRTDNGFRSDQKADIEKAITTTKEHIEGITDFVLCLRELPKSSDVDWFFGLVDSVAEGLQLHLWADEEIESRLTGAAEVLRATYFGDLVITAQQLEACQKRAIAPVKDRWLPEVNVATQTERDLISALLRPRSVEHLTEQAQRLEVLAAGIESGSEAIKGDAIRAGATELAAALNELGARLVQIADACDTHRPNDAALAIRERFTPSVAVGRVRALARTLRSQGIPAALYASSAEAELRHALKLIDDLKDVAGADLLAVIGEAGRGKSQLAAGLTAPGEDHGAGVFILGGDLGHGDTADELAERVPEIGAGDLDQLLEALNASGERRGERVPLVVDGLNEAERPSDWRAQLASLYPALERYPNVQLVVTLRGDYSEQVVIDEAQLLELEWSAAEIEEAIERYFDYYRIEPGASSLPRALFRNLLMLRLFCEAVNPTREEDVGLESLPGDLVAVFSLYREKVGRRLGEQLDQDPRSISSKLALLGSRLWEERARDLPFEELQKIFDEPGAGWSTSLTRALESEGIVSRPSEGGWGEGQRGAVLFDRFAGYLIADSLIGARSPTEVAELLGSDELWNALASGESSSPHPLAGDIAVALVGLVPRRIWRTQLWQVAAEPYRRWSMLQTLELESGLLDDGTLETLPQEIAKTKLEWRRRHPFDRLWEVRDGVQHQLNAAFLDRTLRAMGVAERDLTWTEWVRDRSNALLNDTRALERQWSETSERGDSDDLDARGVAWLLTSTVVRLRDEATRALVAYGRRDPGRLFALALDLLEVNDPYVWERVLAASLGAATAYQMPDPGGQIEEPLTRFLAQLAAKFLGATAASPTSHQGARQYIAGLFEFAGTLHPGTVPDGIDPSQLSWGVGETPVAIGKEDERAEELSWPLGIDFHNYTIGGLFEGRGNYDFDHGPFVAGTAEITGRIWDLGWRKDRFDPVDSEIRDERPRARRDSSERIERYGKKYAWIGYYELAGRLADRHELRTRTYIHRALWADIDPTFPQVPGEIACELPDWANSEPADDPAWYASGPIEVPDDLLMFEDAKGTKWTLVEGYAHHENSVTQREVFGFFRGVLVDPSEAERLKELLEAREYLGNDLIPSAPSNWDTWAGEIPWSANFGWRDGSGEWEVEPYVERVRAGDPEVDIQVEILGHEYEVTTDRTPTAVASGHWVPSQRFAERFGLRELPRTLDLVELDGSAASMTRRGPTGSAGKFLYLRADLLRKYAGDRKFLQLAWGERQIHLGSYSDPPQWMRDLPGHANLWRKLRLPDL